MKTPTTQAIRLMRKRSIEDSIAADFRAVGNDLRRVIVPRLVRQGWSFFHCEACEHRWKEASRDWRSPSGANCPRCGEWWFPYHGEADASLSVDNMGNLVQNVEVMREGASEE